jgi:hypothetical protein
MHFGTGPAPTLDIFYIPVVVDNPQLGNNYVYHFSIPNQISRSGYCHWITLVDCPRVAKGQPDGF